MELNKIDLTTPEQVSLNFRLAGLGSRAAAYIIDWLILLVIFAAIIFMLVFINKQDFYISFLHSISDYLVAVFILFISLIFWGYFVLFEYFSSGRTPGKMLCGIRVIQDNGHSLTFLSSTVRNLFRILDVFFLLGIFMIFFHSRHKRLGDIAGGTIVIYQPKLQKLKKSLEKEIREKTESGYTVWDEWAIKKFETRDWELLKTYILRRSSLNIQERSEMTKKVAAILLPRTGIDVEGKSPELLEQNLFHLYVRLSEEWAVTTDLADLH